jgi:hypothetical protein
MNLELAAKILNSTKVNEAMKSVRVSPGTYPTRDIVRAGDPATADHDSLSRFTDLCESELKLAIGGDVKVSIIFNALDDWSRSGPVIPTSESIHGMPNEKPAMCLIYLNEEKLVN